ncbi:MAG: 50S ribosomal protein L6, partial [Gemmatimonadota bacterium]
MSRIGKLPVPVPNGVQVEVDGARVTVKGPKGELTREFQPAMRIDLVDGAVTVSRPADDARHRALHGLTRSLIANMVEGVTKGYEKRLAIVCVGYRAAMKGDGLEIQAGFSHPVIVPALDGIEFETPTPTQIVVRGNDKQQVGEVAANIRKIRKPEPYKGKG